MVTALIMVLAIIHIALPAMWGNPGLAFKVREAGEGRYGRVILGSSHMFRQVDPGLLDSLMDDGNTTFNAGYPSTFAPESELACARLLDHSEHVPKVILMELTAYQLLDENKQDNFRSWYYVTPSVAMVLARYALTESPAESRNEHVLAAVKAGIKAVFLPGLADDLLDAPPTDSLAWLGQSGNGYFSLDEEMATKEADVVFAKRKATFLADTSILQRRAATLAAYYVDGHVDANAMQRRRLMELSEKAAVRGSRLLFVLPPLASVQIPKLLALFKSLPQGQCIDLCDPTNYPEFYLTVNAFDEGHLNDHGARLFTSELANALSKMALDGKSDTIAH
ncbi:MAG: hypothetical protein ACOH13_01450 [Flavobacteriales bacterium]